jgi:outer membrane receptor protein involved in Fe transport
MAHTIESIASTRRKTKEVSRVDSLLPGELRQKSARLVELLQDYYIHLNEKDEPSYVLNSINNSRDIDEADDQYLSLIQREIAVTIPKSIVTDKVRLYKNLVRYYSIRGSQESIELFFRILFNDTVELYYPYKDVLIPSSGKWQSSLGAFADNTGFLSDTIKLQDSFFYQKFSYVIRTGNNVSTWRDVYNRLVHPAGFIFFG